MAVGVGVGVGVCVCVWMCGSGCVKLGPITVQEKIRHSSQNSVLVLSQIGSANSLRLFEYFMNYCQVMANSCNFW